MGFVCFYLPTGCREAATWRYFIYSVAENQHFQPTGATRCTDSCEKLARLSGTWVRLALRNFSSVDERGECAAPKVENFHYL